MVEAGLTHCILEMTSHGLAQGRLNGVDIDVAVMTNVTHEHLDFHGSWDSYRAAKAIMFHMLQNAWRKPTIDKVAVVNADDPSAGYFAGIPADRVMTYSIEKPSDYRATAIAHRPAATSFAVAGQPIEMKLRGVFNVSNALAALCAARALGADWEVIRQGNFGSSFGARSHGNYRRRPGLHGDG